MEPDAVPSAAPRRLGTSKISSHPDPAAGEKGPWFSCDTAGPSNPFQGSTSHCCCPLSGQQECYSGDRSHPLTAGTESVDALASAPVQHFGLSVILPITLYLGGLRRRR